MAQIEGARRQDTRSLEPRAEQDVSARRALILSLGEFTAEQLPNDLRQRITPRLLEWFRSDPDPGIHGAVSWLLSHSREGPQPRKLDWGLQKAITDLEATFKGKPPATNQRWYVNSQGQTMIVITQPKPFLMGSPFSESYRQGDEVPHLRRIGRNFAIANTSVSVEQFLQFLKENPTVQRGSFERYSPEPGCPIVVVSWYEAAQYCRWLSEKEGIPKEQMVYPPMAEIAKAKQTNTPIKLPPNYLKLTGYRLPTEAEWEYACRAGTTTSRYFGCSDELLGHYALYLHNAKGRSWPGGHKKPNDLGMFDLYGNAGNPCQNHEGDYKPGAGNTPLEDAEDKEDIDSLKSLISRGSGPNSDVFAARSAHRYIERPVNRVVSVGFRIARTQP